jgi:hypothetical protein
MVRVWQVFRPQIAYERLHSMLLHMTINRSQFFQMQLALQMKRSTPVSHLTYTVCMHIWILITMSTATTLAWQAHEFMHFGGSWNNAFKVFSNFSTCDELHHLLQLFIPLSGIKCFICKSWEGAALKYILLVVPMNMFKSFSL